MWSFSTADQDRYKIVVEYRQNPAEALIAAKQNPDIIVSLAKGRKPVVR